MFFHNKKTKKPPTGDAPDAQPRTRRLLPKGIASALAFVALILGLKLITSPKVGADVTLARDENGEVNVLPKTYHPMLWGRIVMTVTSHINTIDDVRAGFAEHRSPWDYVCVYKDQPSTRKLGQFVPFEIFSSPYDWARDAFMAAARKKSADGAGIIGPVCGQLVQDTPDGKRNWFGTGISAGRTWLIDSDGKKLVDFGPTKEFGKRAPNFYRPVPEIEGLSADWMDDGAACMNATPAPSGWRTKSYEFCPVQK